MQDLDILDLYMYMYKSCKFGVIFFLFNSIYYTWWNILYKKVVRPNTRDLRFQLLYKLPIRSSNSYTRRQRPVSRAIRDSRLLFPTVRGCPSTSEIRESHEESEGISKIKTRWGWPIDRGRYRSGPMRDRTSASDICKTTWKEVMVDSPGEIRRTDTSHHLDSSVVQREERLRFAASRVFVCVFGYRAVPTEHALACSS